MDRTASSGPNEAENMLTWYQLTHPWAPLYTPGGNYYSYLGGYNVIQNLVEGGTYENTKAWYTGNAKIDYKIIEGLTISGQAIAQVYNRYKHSNTPTYYNYNWMMTSMLQEIVQIQLNMYTTNHLTYNYTALSITKRVLVMTTG